MGQLIVPEAKGLFAKAETYWSGRQGAAKVHASMLAAQMALQRHFITTETGAPGMLSDVESFLREFDSKVYFIAVPRSADTSSPKHSISYSWLSAYEAQALGEPQFELAITDSPHAIEEICDRTGISMEGNMGRLACTGLPALPSAPYAAELLKMVPPFSIWD